MGKMSKVHTKLDSSYSLLNLLSRLSTRLSISCKNLCRALDIDIVNGVTLSLLDRNECDGTIERTSRCIDICGEYFNENDSIIIYLGCLAKSLKHGQEAFKRGFMETLIHELIHHCQYVGCLNLSIKKMGKRMNEWGVMLPYGCRPHEIEAYERTREIIDKLPNNLLKELELIAKDLSRLVALIINGEELRYSLSWDEELNNTTLNIHSIIIKDLRSSEGKTLGALVMIISPKLAVKYLSINALKLPLRCLKLILNRPLMFNIVHPSDLIIKLKNPLEVSVILKQKHAVHISDAIVMYDVCEDQILCIDKAKIGMDINIPNRYPKEETYIEGKKVIKLTPTYAERIRKWLKIMESEEISPELIKELTLNEKSLEAYIKLIQDALIEVLICN